jgi:GNAT superfamily N-acetyltransferase
MPNYRYNDNVPTPSDRPPVGTAPTTAPEAPLRCDIQTADVSRVAEVVHLLKGVSQWLIDRDLGHWSIDEFRLEDFLAAAEAGELIVGLEDGACAATMLLQSMDSLYWPTEPPMAALYIHKLAVRRASAGRQWSARMIQWAEAAARARAIARLRLDTVLGPVLRRLYESYGFICVDRYPIQVGAFPVIRMERILT